MNSNEHPDMHDCPNDAPFLCDRCGKEYREEDCYGVARNDQVFFCSNDCALEWEDDQIASMYGDY